MFRSCGLLVRHGTQLVNALHRYTGEFGVVLPQAVARGLDPQPGGGNRLQGSGERGLASGLMTIPGVGPLIATALMALAPPPQIFQRSGDSVAWLGLMPRQHSTGSKQRLGATTRMGERSLRRLLVIWANRVGIKRVFHRRAQPGTWLSSLLSRKPLKYVRVAFGNKMARAVWALRAKGEYDRAPAVAA